MDDVKLLTRVLLDWPSAKNDPTCFPIPWREEKVDVPEKLAFGVLPWDGVVMPHPPIRRAIRSTADKLRAEGHDGELPYNLQRFAYPYRF